MSESLFSIDPAVHGGTPCFAGTRVPVRSLIHHLRQGYDVEEFLKDFPGVKRAQVDRLLALVEHTLVGLADEHAKASRPTPAPPDPHGRP